MDKRLLLGLSQLGRTYDMLKPLQIRPIRKTSDIAPAARAKLPAKASGVDAVTPRDLQRAPPQ
eukprot:8273838-Pyramimonas_sp.AAC.1